MAGETDARRIHGTRADRAERDDFFTVPRENGGDCVRFRSAARERPQIDAVGLRDLCEIPPGAGRAGAGAGGGAGTEGPAPGGERSSER